MSQKYCLNNNNITGSLKFSIMTVFQVEVEIKALYNQLNRQAATYCA